MHKGVVGPVDGGIHIARDRLGLIDPLLIDYVEPQRFRPESRSRGPSASDQSQKLPTVSVEQSCADRNGIRRQGNSPPVKRRIGNRGVGSCIPAGLPHPNETVRRNRSICTRFQSESPGPTSIVGAKVNFHRWRDAGRRSCGFVAGVFDVEIECPFQSLDFTSLQ